MDLPEFLAKVIFSKIVCLGFQLSAGHEEGDAPSRAAPPHCSQQEKIQLQLAPHAPATEPEEMELKLSSPPQHTNQELEQRARWKEERETDRQQPMTAG
ncbi:hypothetical protein GW17_00036458 [Ensete ventricosum]|nr:hypothetical protein GW17_00036458 [Ensete ventricosum]